MTYWRVRARQRRICIIPGEAPYDAAAQPKCAQAAVFTRNARRNPFKVAPRFVDAIGSRSPGSRHERRRGHGLAGVWSCQIRTNAEYLPDGSCFRRLRVAQWSDLDAFARLQNCLVRIGNWSRVRNAIGRSTRAGCLGHRQVGSSGRPPEPKVRGSNPLGRTTHQSITNCRDEGEQYAVARPVVASRTSWATRRPASMARCVS
jgi:hypothetical protein